MATATNPRTGRRRKQKKAFTTGEVAKLCEVSPRTVQKWCDAGALRHYRIPCSTDRRITRNDLVAFFEANGMPTRELAAGTNVLTVCVPAALASAVRERVPDKWRLESVDSGYDVGVIVADFPPDVVLVDFVLGRAEACRIAERLAGNWSRPTLIALAGEDADVKALFAAGFDAVHQPPFDAAAIADQIKTSLSR